MGTPTEENEVANNFMEDVFNEHVALILHTEGCTIGGARWMAWLEGPEGYKNRLQKEQDNAEEV